MSDKVQKQSQPENKKKNYMGEFYKKNFCSLEQRRLGMLTHYMANCYVYSNLIVMIQLKIG